ncbi:MAG: hypothetical protein ABSB00_00070 [Minisyncoccia bacterium]|jgi:hypothetical protein
MKHNIWSGIFWIAVFVVLYSIFVTEVQITVTDYSDIIVGTTFFFTLFIGYFITRQNDRYSEIADQLTSNDGLFSYLYRITGLVPRIQAQVRDIVKEHYKKIVDSGDLAYHVTHPSNTLTRMTAALGSITEDEMNNPAAGAAWGFLFEVISDLQITRKKILNLYGEKLVSFQWAIIYILALSLVVSLNFVPSGSTLVIILKVCFGTAVFLSIVLLRQLDNLTLFGNTVGMDSVHDVLGIVEERDATKIAANK